MYLGLILDMALSEFADRDCLVFGDASMTYDMLAKRSWAVSDFISTTDASCVLYLGGNHEAFPVALFGAAGAGLPFVPLNYRLGEEQLSVQIKGQPGGFVIYEGARPGFVSADASMERTAFLDALDVDGATPPLPPDSDLPSLLLYTSGTTGEPKAALLRHRHLMSYLIGTVEFAAADASDVSLVSVPPYHIAGVANLLSNLYAGRRAIYLDRFDAGTWLQTVRDQRVTQAMVIPTMLARIVESLGDAESADTPSLRAISYGGSRMPAAVLSRALDLFPTTGFVNAYGLTETSSTIALLGPDDHREAHASSDPVVRRRLASAGRLLPNIELEVRDEEGRPLPAGSSGLLFLRGEQISGEYTGGTAVDGDGWFATRDLGWVDEDGYLFIEGRSDDTIIRGGENIAPAEIEDVLLSHEEIADAVVIGVPDDEWGQRIIAVAVRRSGGEVSAEELKDLVRTRLRSSKTPETIEFWAELPRTETGKLLRRHIVAQLASS